MKLSALLQKAAELRHYQLHMRERSLMVRRQQIRLEQEEEALRQRRQAGAAQIAPRRPDSERPTARASAPGYKTALATLFRQSSGMSWWQRQPRFSVWQLFCPSQFPAFRNGVRVQRWLVPTDTTFAAGDVLCELQFTPDRRRGNSRWQDYLLQAPQDGYLLGVEHSSDAVRSKDALGFFIPLPEWQAFVTLLDTHEAAIARLREEERRLAGFRQELAERSRAKQRAAVPGRAAAAVEPSRERQETALAELTARLRRSYARVTAGLPPHRTWLQAQPLAECLALLLSGAADGTESAWPALLASRERTELERALKRLLAAQVPFSAAELRRLQPVLQRLNAVQARFAAIDHEVREAMRDGNLSAAQEEAFLCRQEQEVTALYREHPRA